MRWERAVCKQGGCSGVLGTNQLGRAVPPDEAELLAGSSWRHPGARAGCQSHAGDSQHHKAPATGDRASPSRCRSEVFARGSQHLTAQMEPSGSQQLPALLRDPRSPPAPREVWPCFTGHGFGWCYCRGGVALSSPLLEICNLDGSGGVLGTCWTLRTKRAFLWSLPSRVCSAAVIAPPVGAVGHCPYPSKTPKTHSCSPC